MKRPLLAVVAAAAVFLVAGSSGSRRPRSGKRPWINTDVPGSNCSRRPSRKSRQALRSRVISAERLTRMYLKRIEAYEDTGPAINAYQLVNDNAVREARRLDALHDRSRTLADAALRRSRAAQGQHRHADMPTAAGSVALNGSLPPDDAFITKEIACGRSRHPRQGHAHRVREFHRRRHADGLQLPRRLRFQSLRSARRSAHRGPVQRRASSAANRRIELGSRHWRQCESRRCRDRHGDIGFDPESCEREWRRRHQTHRGPGEPRRHHPDHGGSGYGRAHHSDGDRCGHRARRHRWLRPQRPGNGRLPHARQLFRRLHAISEQEGASRSAPRSAAVPRESAARSWKPRLP